MAKRTYPRFDGDDANLAPPGTEDDVFRVGAQGMKDAVAASRSKKALKYFLAEIEYQGRRHEVWLARINIRHRTLEQLAGLIKTKCLDG